MGFIAKLAASKIGHIKEELEALRERLRAAKGEDEKHALRKSIREKETYYHILADQLKRRSRI